MQEVSDREGFHLNHLIFAIMCSSLLVRHLAFLAGEGSETYLWVFEYTFSKSDFKKRVFI